MTIKYAVKFTQLFEDGESKEKNIVWPTYSQAKDYLEGVKESEKTPEKSLDRDRLFTCQNARIEPIEVEG